MEELSPTEVMEGIFYFFTPARFENNRRAIHTAFFKIREAHPILLKHFTFRKKALFPRSSVLDQALSNLQHDSLGKINPTLDIYEIHREGLEKRWKSDLRDKIFKINSSLADELKQVAKELESSLPELPDSEER